MITAERVILVRYCGPRKGGKELKQRFHCCSNEAIYRLLIILSTKKAFISV